MTHDLERSYRIETPLYHADFTSRGARLISVELLRFPSAHGVTGLAHKRLKYKRGDLVPDGDRAVLAGGPLFGLDLGAGDALQSLADVVYAVEESTDAAGATRTLIFTARDSAGMTVRQSYRVRPDDYALDYAVEIRNVPPGCGSPTTRSRCGPGRCSPRATCRPTSARCAPAACWAPASTRTTPRA